VFTGIIEEIGTIRSVRKGNTSGSLTIEAGEILSGVKIGDSIAVNGICLTVTGLEGSGFTVDVMHETFDRSNGAMFQAGMRVNLERAMAADGRFGGHIVSGHIDGVGRVKRTWKDENAVWYEISAPAGILRYIVEKGSIAVDGISLTVAKAGTDSFQVSVIPHTRNMTTLSEKKRGDMLNLENDCIGKYVEKLLETGRGKPGISADFLAENGFL
jgi:riboflavin synthase